MRFTIRDLLWLMVVVAFYLGWCIQRRDADRQRLHDHVKLTAQEQELASKDEQIGFLRERLRNLMADERALREQLTEFVETQEDKARIDVAPGLFHRVAAPK